MSINFRFYNSFEKGDTRCDATFMPSYRKKESGELYVYGTHVCKIWALSMLREIESMMVILFFTVYPGYI